MTAPVSKIAGAAICRQPSTDSIGTSDQKAAKESITFMGHGHIGYPVLPRDGYLGGFLSFCLSFCVFHIWTNGGNGQKAHDLLGFYIKKPSLFAKNCQKVLANCAK